MKKFFENNPELIFTIPMFLFFLMGCGLLSLALIFPNPVPVVGWITIGGFIVFPGFILYAFIFGSGYSEKQLKEIDERRESLLFDDDGLSIVMPLFDSTCFIAWSSIETIIYTNYVQDDYDYFEINWNSLPIYTRHENPMWLNRIFRFSPKRNPLRLRSDCKNFSEFPEIIRAYLPSTQAIDWSDPKKGTLISRTTRVKDGVSATTEQWKPKQNYDSSQLLFDRRNRSLNEIHSG